MAASGGDTDKKNAATLRNEQKSQLEKLMADPDKPVHIPERPADWKPREPPEFVRFYMGSSAGAGSEVFHVYRHLRRRENVRVQHIEESAENEVLDDAFQERLAWNKVAAEQRTAKKRLKRLKKKQKRKESGKDMEDAKTEGEDKEGKEEHPASSRDQEDKDEDEEEEEDPHFVIGGR